MAGSSPVWVTGDPMSRWWWFCLGLHASTKLGWWWTEIGWRRLRAEAGWRCLGVRLGRRVPCWEQLTNLPCLWGVGLIAILLPEFNQLRPKVLHETDVDRLLDLEMTCLSSIDGMGLLELLAESANSVSSLT